MSRSSNSVPCDVGYRRPARLLGIGTGHEPLKLPGIGITKAFDMLDRVFGRF
jgi:hypothetical protein